jgi:hypothetical protein
MRISYFVLGLLLAGSLVNGVLAQSPVGTAFTYQGQLRRAGVPVNDTADFQFSLWDAATGGAQVGSTVPVADWPVVSGLFAVTLDFGAASFTDQARWLQIAVRSPAGGGTFTILTPRQELTPAPFALQTRGLTVDPVGNVGIGTTAPEYPLDVKGLVRATGGFVFPDGSQQNTAAWTAWVGPRGVQEFTELGDYAWEAPADVHRVMVELWGGSGGGGGGGGGGYSPSDPNDYPQIPGGNGGGGGGGAAYLRTVLDVIPGHSYVIRIGQGGEGGSAGSIQGSGGDGQDGAATMFIDSSDPNEPMLTASGGAKGHGGTGASGPADGVGGAAGAGGHAGATAGIVRDGTDGTPGGSTQFAIAAGPGGMGACGSISLPFTANPYYTFVWPGAAGGTGGQYYSSGPNPGWAGYPGSRGYAVLHW